VDWEGVYANTFQEEGILFLYSEGGEEAFFSIKGGINGVERKKKKGGTIQFYLPPKSYQKKEKWRGEDNGPKNTIRFPIALGGRRNLVQGKGDHRYLPKKKGGELINGRERRKAKWNRTTYPSPERKGNQMGKGRIFTHRGQGQYPPGQEGERGITTSERKGRSGITTRSAKGGTRKCRLRAQREKESKTSQGGMRATKQGGGSKNNNDE